VNALLDMEALSIESLDPATVREIFEKPDAQRRPSRRTQKRLKKAKSRALQTGKGRPNGAPWDPRAPAPARAVMKMEVEGKTPGQRGVLAAIAAAEGSGVFVVGPAGSGKTFLAVALGVSLMVQGKVEKMVLCRPTANNGENLGFLPGKAGEKVAPWLVPIFDAVDKLVGRSTREAWIKSEKMEVVPFQFMQGRTFESAWVVLDEAQNTTPSQMEGFLTRPGEGSTYVVVGDPRAQTAIQGPSGMVRALAHIRNLSLPVPVVRLGYEDIVRSRHARMWAEAFGGDHADPEAA
jgi:phosphate starvation-inducible PhoH-like protein